KDGAIDWLCLPNLDSPSVFAAVLDAERGGSLVVQPAIPFESTRRYLPNTNVLETTFTTGRGAVRIVDAMPLPDHRLGPMRERARARIVLATAFAEPLVLPARSAVESRVAQTIRFWETWSNAREYRGPWNDMVLRSALALKLLIFAPSGASAAAPTTSLPEEIGGVRNWDYRYCWIRDSSFLIDALLQLGCRDEAQALFWWFMQATALTEPRLQVLYRLDGGAQARELELPSLKGYRGS